jgi:hypothetical protein
MRARSLCLIRLRAQQRNAMLTTHHESAPLSGNLFSGTTLFPDALLASLQTLNCEFLTLAVEPQPWPTQRGFGLRAEILQSIRELTVRGQAAICASNYSLFTLRLCDPWFWRTMTSRACTAGQGTLKENAQSSDRRELLVLDIMLFVWHVAQTAPLAGRLMLGMSDEVHAALSALSLREVRQLAQSGEIPLVARWPDNPCFWPDLVRFARPGYSRELQLTHLQGTQLLAAELATSQHRSSIR